MSYGKQNPIQLPDGIGISPGASSSKSVSQWYTFENPEDMKALLDDAKEGQSLDLWILLAAHIEESEKPTLMVNPDVKGSAR